jgi:hypothetical protein
MEHLLWEKKDLSLAGLQDAAGKRVNECKAEQDSPRLDTTVDPLNPYVLQSSGKCEPLFLR